MLLVMQDEQRDLAKTIRVSGSILLSTVSNFLDFFKMEAGKSLDVVRTEVDLHVWPPMPSPERHCAWRHRTSVSGMACLRHYSRCL